MADKRRAITRGYYGIPDVIDPPNKRCIQLMVPDDPQHLAVFMGAIRTLALWHSWERTGDNKGSLVAKVWSETIAQMDISGKCDDLPEEGDCTEYGLQSSIVSWEPNDPYRSPEFVPPGYRFPPWFVVGPVTVIPGTLPGDVVTDLLHAPIVNPLEAGLPRFRIRVHGEGTVEIHFVSFPTAGIALMVVDDDPLTAKYTDLNQSLTASVGSFVAESAVEIKITGAGEHHIDVSMVPNVSETIPFVHWGGGIRSIVLCGFDQSPVENAVIFRTVDTCLLQYSQDGGSTWFDAFDARACADLAISDAIKDGIIAVPGQPKPDGEIPSGMCYEYNVELEGRGIYQIPVPVYDGYTIECIDATGTWWNGDLLTVWKCPSGDNGPLGQCFPDSKDYDPTYPLPDAPVMRLICHIGSDYFDLYNQTVGVPTGTGTATAYIQANDNNLSDNQGSIRFKLIVCAANPTVTITPVTASPNICHIGSASELLVGVGDTFTFTPSNQSDCPGRGPSGVYDGKFTLSTHATLKVVSVTSWSGGTGWQWFSPDNSFSGAPNVDDQQSTLGFAGNSDTQYTVEFQVVSIP